MENGEWIDIKRSFVLVTLPVKTSGRSFYRYVWYKMDKIWGCKSLRAQLDCIRLYCCSNRSVKTVDPVSDKWKGILLGNLETIKAVAFLVLKFRSVMRCMVYGISYRRHAALTFSSCRLSLAPRVIFLLPREEIWIFMVPIVVRGDRTYPKLNSRSPLFER